MDQKELRQYRQLKREVQQLRTRLEALEATMYAPSAQKYTATPNAKHRTGKTMDDVVARHMELKDLYAERLADAERLLLRIERAISTIDDSAERQIMQRRYVDGWSWPHIIAEMAPKGVSERQVYRHHGWALLKIKEV